MANDIEHLFVYLLFIVYFQGEMSIQTLYSFLIWVIHLFYHLV